MYYTFSARPIKYRNTSLQAQIIGEVPVPQPHWWDAQPTQSAIPFMTFTYRSEVALPDNVFTGTTFDIYSPRLIKLIRDRGVNFETFPVRIISTRHEGIIAHDYQIFHLLELDDGLDLKKTLINRQVISLLRSQEPKLLFRDREYSQFVIIHSDLKQEMEWRGITGCSFNPILNYDDVVNPHNW